MLSNTQWGQLFPLAASATCVNTTNSGLLARATFLEAATAFPGFATSAADAINRRELAAFLAHASQETTGGGDTGGLCFVQELCGVSGTCGTYCQTTGAAAAYPCAAGRSYHGRGPLQLSWNYNYGAAGQALGADLLNQPQLLVSDALLSWKSALWFWMTAQYNKPSCHDVITGLWTPSATDIAAGRTPGFGTTINIINGIHCNEQLFAPGDKAYITAVAASRLAFYSRYTTALGTTMDANTSCAAQQRFG